jgi:hypothetical protein
MTHPNLNHLSSQSDLDYEIGQSKQCLEDHGFNPTIFAYPNGDGSDNPKVVNTVAKYYDLARTAETDSKSALTFLNCDSSSNVDSEQQQQKTYCATYLSDGELLLQIDTLSIAGLINTLTKAALLMVMMLVAAVVAIVTLAKSFGTNTTTLRCL